MRRGLSVSGVLLVVLLCFLSSSNSVSATKGSDPSSVSTHKNKNRKRARATRGLSAVTLPENNEDKPFVELVEISDETVPHSSNFVRAHKTLNPDEDWNWKSGKKASYDYKDCFKGDKKKSSKSSDRRRRQRRLQGGGKAGKSSSGDSSFDAFCDEVMNPDPAPTPADPNPDPQPAPTPADPQPDSDPTPTDAPDVPEPDQQEPVDPPASEICTAIQEQSPPSTLQGNRNGFDANMDVSHSNDITADQVGQVLDSLQVPVALWTAGCESEAQAAADALLERRRKLQASGVEYAQVGDFTAGKYHTHAMFVLLCVV